MRDGLSFIATAIGSMPHTSAEPALDLIFKDIPTCPHWPQLPNRGFREHMEIQFTEGLPCAVFDETNERIFFDTADEDRFTDALSRFYESYLLAEATDEWATFKITEKCAEGVSAFEKRLKKSPAPCLKVQTTGPITIALTLMDERGSPICRNEAFRDVLVKGLIAKCRWQLKKFAPYADRLLCFIDEPIFETFGSRFSLPVSHYDVVTILNETVEAIHAAGALCGLHCCGRSELSIPVEAGVDIISFDAYSFGEIINLYPRQVKKHFEADGYIAWGIVPTSEEIYKNDAASLIGLYDDLVKQLSSVGIDRELVHEKSIITPSCGTGTLSEQTAERVYTVLGETAARLLERN